MGLGSTLRAVAYIVGELRPEKPVPAIGSQCQPVWALASLSAPLATGVTPPEMVI